MPHHETDVTNLWNTIYNAAGSTNGGKVHKKKKKKKTGLIYTEKKNKEVNYRQKQTNAMMGRAQDITLLKRKF